MSAKIAWTRVYQAMKEKYGTTQQKVIVLHDLTKNRDHCLSRTSNIVCVCVCKCR